MTPTGPLPTVRRHPFVGALGGALVGAGVALLLALYGVIAFGTWPPVVVPIVGLAVGLAWGLWGPVRVKDPLPEPGVLAFNERVQQALAENEAAIDSASEDPPLRLPDLEAPSAGDDTDWHRRDPGAS